jgi:hypothetical protein
LFSQHGQRASDPQEDRCRKFDQAAVSWPALFSKDFGRLSMIEIALAKSVALGTR